MPEYLCTSPEETIALGVEVGKQLPKGSIVCFFGDLGAGKTTFIKGFSQGAANIDIDQVNSPTFSYLNIYKGQKTVYHFDLYRLRDIDEFLSMGFDEFLYADGICCVEWSEKIVSLLPDECISITLNHLSDNKRLITIQGN